MDDDLNALTKRYKELADSHEGYAICGDDFERERELQEELEALSARIDQVAKAELASVEESIELLVLTDEDPERLLFLQTRKRELHQQLGQG